MDSFVVLSCFEVFYVITICDYEKSLILDLEDYIPNLTNADESDIKDSY